MRASLRPSYTVDTTVNDAAGNSGSDSTSVTEGEPNGTPAVDGLSASEVETSDSDAEFDADWTVSDADGDLSQVDVVVYDSSGAQVDSSTTSVSGSSASGTDQFKIEKANNETFDVVLTVTDGNGNTTSDTRTVTE